MNMKLLVKRASRRIWLLSRPVSRRVQPLIMEYSVRWPWLANIYYCFDRSYEREHRATLYGKLCQVRKDGAASEEGARYRLRRSIHRLEKGLIMRPQREVFARDYIGETVDLYASCAAQPQSNGASDGTKLLNNWAGDVLHRYFDEVGSDPVINRAREKFQSAVQLPNGHGSHPGSAAPYRRDSTPLSITIEDMLTLARRRRSVRWYLPQPVPRELIDNAVRVGAYSPSACNRQPFEFRIFDEPELVQKVASIPLGTKGFYENFPCVVVLIGKVRAFPFERDRHVIYIDAALAAMAFQFALEVQGVSSCCINWPDIPERERMMAQTLHLAPDERPVMLISLGFPDPDGQVPYSQKKPLEELRSYNQT